VLVAANPASLGGLMITNFNVAKASLGDAASAPNLTETGKAELTQIKGTAEPSPAPLASTIHVAAGTAFAIRYSLKLSNGQVAGIASYVLLIDQGGNRFKYEITFGSLTPDPDKPLFDAVLKSFTPLR